MKLLLFSTNGVIIDRIAFGLQILIIRLAGSPITRGDSRGRPSVRATSRNQRATLMP
jgi:hypothetical protein